jgi:excisionase family DNA binding protein
VPPTASDELSLQEAAEALGVHYQTAYKWVRRGELPATVVRGRYMVTRADVDELAARRSRPTRAAARPSRRNLAGHAEHMFHALVTGDESSARKMVVRLANEGVPVVTLIQEVLVPPLTRIGSQWRKGNLAIWIEHRASAIVERLLGVLHPTPRGRRRGTAVVAALSGDHHALPTAMAAAALRDDNWHVHHLGCDVPAKEVTGFVETHDVDLVVLTVTTPEVLSTAQRLAATLVKRGTRAVVGGPGRTLADLVEMARRP